MSRKLLSYTALGLILGNTAFADVPKVAVDIAPVHSLVSRVMEGVGTPNLVIPAGASPHGYSLRPSEAKSLQDADMVIWMGEDLAPWMENSIETLSNNAEIITLLEESGTKLLDFREGALFEEHDHDDHDDHDDHEGHDHGGIDPHFFTDPGRMATVVEELNEFLVANFPNADQGFVSTANSYAQDLMDLDAEVEEILSGIPASSRLLVTNHAVFGYFADSYSFEILGEIIPSSSTLASASAQQLSNLAEELRSNNVTAIFADASASDALAQTLAAEVGGIEVITLYTESLGDPGSSGESYIDMVRFNAEAIASGLLQ